MELQALRKDSKTKKFDQEVIIIKIMDMGGSPVAVYYSDDKKVLGYDYVSSFKIK
jgi:hypothetical protein